MVEPDKTALGKCRNLIRMNHAVVHPQTGRIDLIDVRFNRKRVEQKSLAPEIDDGVLCDDSCFAVAQIQFLKAERLKEIHDSFVQHLNNGVSAQVASGTEVSRLDRKRVGKLVKRLLSQLYSRHVTLSRANFYMVSRRSQGAHCLRGLPEDARKILITSIEKALENSFTFLYRCAML